MLEQLLVDTKFFSCVIPAISYSIDEGADPIHLTNVQCRSSDDLIIGCPTGPSVPCNHAQDVVVQCSKCVICV